MSRKTGVPAFPIGNEGELHRIGLAATEGAADITERDRLYIAATAQAAQGMTLRDYFAAKAMQGILCSGSQWPDQKIAELAYSMADAMLAGREVQS